MKYPHCKEEIDDKIVGKYFGVKGGKASKRELDPETARKMVEVREARKKGNVHEESCGCIYYANTFELIKECKDHPY